MERDTQRRAEAAHDAEQQRRSDIIVDASHTRYAGVGVADLRAQVQRLQCDLTDALRELWLRSAVKLGSLDADWAEPTPADWPWESAERFVFMAKHHMQCILTPLCCEVRHTDTAYEVWGDPGELGEEPEPELRRLVRASRAYAADDRITRQALHEPVEAD